MQETNERGFRLWLKESKNYQTNPISDAISRCRRVEKHYGDLDDLYEEGRLVGLLENLVCNASGVPRHRIPFQECADPVTGTASLRSAVRRYQEFRDSTAG